MAEAPSSQTEVSFVIPCLNEAETIERCVRAARSCIDAHGLNAEVIVADNGSTDGSREIAARAGARVVPVTVRGYGAALLAGIEAAQGRYVIMGDADGQHDLAEGFRFVQALRAGHQLVMGSRVRGTVMPGAMSWKNRYLGNSVLSCIGQRLFRAPVSDFNCGFRGLDRAAFLSLGVRTTGMEFASEHIIKSALHGLSITEVPITVHPSGRSRPAHLRPWRDGWRHLRFMLLMSPKGTLIVPGLVLMLLGALLSAWVLISPMLPPGWWQLDVHTLVGACIFIVVGYQAATVGVAAHVYASEQGLIPPSGRLKWALGRFTLERGVGIGLLLFLSGFVILSVLTVYALAKGLPREDVTTSLRPMVLGGTLLALGAQTTLMSFFYSMLGLPYRGRPAGLATMITAEPLPTRGGRS